MDSNRSHDLRAYRVAQPGAGHPQPAQQESHGSQPPRRTSPSVYPYDQDRPTTSSTYPYEQPAPRQPAQQQVAQPQRTAPAQRPAAAPRRALGLLAFAVLTLLSMPVHIAAVFFIYVEFESPGDPVTAVLLVSGAFIGSFAALFVTGLLSQLAGGFPGRWRARVTFAVLSGVIALGLTYLAALVYF